MEDVLQTTATHCQPEILRNIIHFSVSSLTAWAMVVLLATHFDLISTTHIYIIIHSKYFSNSILIGLNLMANSS